MIEATARFLSAHLQVSGDLEVEVTHDDPDDPAGFILLLQTPNGRTYAAIEEATVLFEPRFYEDDGMGDDPIPVSLLVDPAAQASLHKADQSHPDI